MIKMWWTKNWSSKQKSWHKGERPSPLFSHYYFCGLQGGQIIKNLINFRSSTCQYFSWESMQACMCIVVLFGIANWLAIGCLFFRMISLLSTLFYRPHSYDLHRAKPLFSFFFWAIIAKNFCPSSLLMPYFEMANFGPFMELLKTHKCPRWENFAAFFCTVH